MRSRTHSCSSLKFGVIHQLHGDRGLYIYQAIWSHILETTGLKMSAITGSPQASITATPNPTPDGVFWTTPDILPEGDPRPTQTASAG